MRKKYKLFLIILAVLTFLFVLLQGVNYLLVKDKIKKTDISIDTELFELCDFLYNQKYDESIYDIYSLVFEDDDMILFFEANNMNETEAFEVINRWGAKYILSVSDVLPQNDAVSAISSWLSNVYQNEFTSIDSFLDSLYSEVNKSNGLKTGFFESIKLKRFLLCFSIAIDDVDMLQFDKEQCCDFIARQYISIGDWQTSYFYSLKADGMDIQKDSVLLSSLDNVGYAVRFIFIALCVLALLVSIFICTKKKIIIGIFGMLLSAFALIGAFVNTDVEKPNISNNIDMYIETILQNYIPNDDLHYNIYFYDCESYYGTICFSREDYEQKQEELSKKEGTIKSIYNENAYIYSYISCVRDNYGLPNCSTGMATIYVDDVRIFIKYTYKANNRFSILECLTFKQYLSIDEINIEDVVEHIDINSQTIVSKEENK